MILEVHAAPHYQMRRMLHPNEALISSTVEEQPWDDITFILLKVDDWNWFEVSGSLRPEDGLSARYCEHGEELVAARPPASLDECVQLLLSYWRSDNQWRSAIGWR
jgi:hypothetical protein